MAEGKLKRANTKKNKMGTAQTPGGPAFDKQLPLTTENLLKERLNERFLNALIKGNIEEAKQCLEEGADVNCRLKEREITAQFKRHESFFGPQNDIIIFSEGTTPLMVASALQVESIESMVRLFIGLGADVNAKDRGDITALMNAALYSTPEICEMLIQNGADVNARNCASCTPLIFAAIHNNLDNCEVLASHNAELEIKDDENNTALSEAARACHKKIVKYLLLHGANPLAKNNKGKTPKEMIDFEDLSGRMGEHNLEQMRLNNRIERLIERYEKLWMPTSSSLGEAEKIFPLIISSARNCKPEDIKRNFKEL